jgi:negative regulator of sigma E activity
MDLGQAKGVAIPPEAAAMMKQAGMDKMVSLIQPDKKVTAIMYPNAQAYAEMPVTEDELGADKVEFTEVGKEMVNGHPCKKVKLTSTDSKGKAQEAFVWRASDLKDFPIQMQMSQKDNTVLVKFRDPKLEMPAAAQFEIPAGYTKYPNLPALMQAVMMKMLSGAGEK